MNKNNIVDIRIDYGDLKPPKNIKYIQWKLFVDYGWDRAKFLYLMPHYIIEDIRLIILDFYTKLNPIDTCKMGHLIMYILQELIKRPNSDIIRPTVLFPSIEFKASTVMFNREYYNRDKYDENMSCFKILNHNILETLLETDLVELKVNRKVEMYSSNVKYIENLIEWLKSNHYFYSKNYAKIACHLHKKIKLIKAHIQKYNF